MPYQIDWGPRCVTFTYSGTITARDILASNEAVYGDERFDNLLWQIVSFEHVDGLEFSSACVKKIAYMDKAAARTNSKITVCFVGRSQFLLDIEKAYVESGTEPAWPVAHFLSIEDAEAYMEKELSRRESKLVSKNPS